MSCRENKVSFKAFVQDQITPSLNVFVADERTPADDDSEGIHEDGAIWETLHY